MQAKRSEIIGAILRAAKQPTPQIAPIKEWLGENGQWYRPLARPFNLKMTDQHRIIGYAFVSTDGTTYGTMGLSVIDMENRWSALQEKRMADFRAELEAMDDERIQSQADYWLKHPIIRS